MQSKIQINPFKLASTYAEVRRTAVGVLLVLCLGIEVFHRATKEARGTSWVATLPLVPYLINHLSSSTATSVPSPLTNASANTYTVMQKEKWICYSVSTSTQGERMLTVNAYTPFGDQVGPCVQFDGAFFGQNPARSLKPAKVRSTEAYAIMKQLTRLRLRARQCVDPELTPR